MSEGKKVLVANVKMLGAAQTMVECDIDFEGANVAKILSVQSVPRIVSTECLENEIQFEGVAFVKLFVLCQDSAVKAIASQHKFSGRLERKEVSVHSKVLPQCNSLDCVVNQVTERAAKAVCSIESVFLLCDNAEIEAAAFNETSLEVQQKELQTWAVNACLTVQGEAFGEIMIPGEDVRVALIENSIVLKGTSLQNGYGYVKGEICSKLLFTSGSKPALQSATTVTPFVQEVEIPNATPEGMLHASVALCEEKFKLLLSQEKKQAVASLEFVIAASICEYELTDNTVIADAYSSTHITKCAETNFDQTTPVGELFFEKKVEGNVVLDDGQEKVRKLLAFSGATLGAIETTVKEDKVLITGVAYANIIYDTDAPEEEPEPEVQEGEVPEKQEVFAPSSLQIAIPFEVSEDIAGKNTFVGVGVMLDDVDISVKKGKNVFLDAKIKAHLFFTKTESNSCITSISMLSERKEKEEGIEIVFAKKGNTLWDIGKKLGVPSAQIIAQNPGLTSPLEQDERIVLYYQCTDLT